MNNIEAIYPLSPPQQGILFHSLYRPASGEYVVQFVCTVYRELNVAAFKRAWARLLERHPVLQSAFVWEGQPEALQVVCRQVEMPWEEGDWRGLPGPEQRARLEDFLAEDRRRGFDLVKPPLMRCALFRTGEDSYRFVWTQHHLLLDGWSRSIVLKELLDLYEAFSRSREPGLPLPRPYKDYIAWLRRQDAAKSEAFWRQTLEGFAAPTPLAGVGRGGGSAEGTGKHELHLSPETTAALAALTRRHKLTLNTVVQGCWALLLSRYSGESDVVFGATVSGRPPELEGVEFMVGVLINVLPVRVRLSEGERLLPWLEAVQRQQVLTREYEHSPLVRVQGWSEVPHGVPLFESILTFENYPVDAALREWKGGVGIKDVRIIDQTNYPLIVTATPGPRLALSLTYDRARLEDEAAGRMLERLRVLLDAVGADAERRLGELPWLTPREREQLIAEGARAASAPPAGACLHELFEGQARRRPDAVAVVAEGAELSYGELNRRANQLAHHLRRRGVRPGALVGLCVERSPEMLVGLLAVLKAGAAYLPLDPEYPAERLGYMLRDARASALLTNRWQQQSLGEHECEVVCFDADAEAVAREPEENPAAAASPDHLAYCIYTSGSTGRPKGVLVSHANVVRLFEATRPWFDFSERDVWTLFHSYAFDFSVWELWGALLHGGRLVVVPYATSRSPEAFRRLLRRERVTVLNQTPSAFGQLVRAEEADGDAGETALRLVIFGGEALEPSSLAPWVERHGCERPRLVNMYGITETTVHVTYRPVTEADVRGGGGSVIGRRIPDLSLHVLDRRLKPVPAHVAGELYVGGAGVAWGYLNRPALTAERFIPDPFGAEPGARLYRSGDLARRLPGGDLEYLGRGDQQVKMRGFRVEPGEVEAALKQHPAVREAAVAAAADASGEWHLVGYVVPADDERPPTVGELRRALGERLPEYMVPSNFVLLDELPLTAHGKLDRKALPAPDGGRPELGAAYVAPRTELEQMIANLWQEILQVEKVGVYDDFFELGGHSLLATRIVTRLNKAFRIELSVLSLFQGGNVAALAAAVEETLLREVEGMSETSPDAASFDQELLGQRDYWVEKLSARPPRAGLPPDFEGAGRGGADGATVEARLDAGLYAGLRELAGGSALDLYATLVAAAQVCLSRYTGRRDVAVGSPALEGAGRANALAVLNELDGRETFRGLSERVRATLAEAYARQDYPYERLARELGLGAPPFDVAVSLEGLHGELPEVGCGVTMRFRPEGDGLGASVWYDRETFQRGSVEEFWKHFEAVLRSGVEDGAAPVPRLGALGGEERLAVVEGWNRTRSHYPQDALIHELFERQAALSPRAEAVASGGESLSYGELNRRANRLARYLMSCGVERGVRVGVYMDHCPEVLVGLLAVLKAGAAYVPLEPAHPLAHLSFIISDAALPVILTRRHMADGLPSGGERLVLLDEEGEAWGREDDADLGRAADPADPAYVIYTSGSTGRPKGVEVSHGALVNYVCWAREAYVGEERLNFALYSSLAFDLTVTSLFVPLVSGGGVVVYPWEGREPPLQQIIDDGRVGVLKLTPSHLALIKARDNRRGGVRRLVVGGEALSAGLAREVSESFGHGVEIFNEYGPTEATVGCMIHRFDPEADTRAAVPIGRPAANVQIYLLDERLEPVAANIVGELFVSGDGLAQGYLNRAGLTAERFVPNPFVAGRRMYRTGDLARRLHDGSLEYLGRGDEQVKFHGHRVELSAIQWAMKKHPLIRESVVRVLRDQEGQEVMVGYYVSRQELEPGRLREFLKEFIIEETIPNLFVHLRRLPLTLNGKVNREALPALEEVRRKLQGTYAGPRSEAEARLAEIWARALGLERVSVEDNFFELGGHSLIAMQMLSRIREAFGVELPLRAVFDRPTVAGLARLLEEGSELSEEDTQGSLQGGLA